MAGWSLVQFAQRDHSPTTQKLHSVRYASLGFLPTTTPTQRNASLALREPLRYDIFVKIVKIICWVAEITYAIVYVRRARLRGLRRRR